MSDDYKTHLMPQHPWVKHSRDALVIRRIATMKIRMADPRGDNLHNDLVVARLAQLDLFNRPFTLAKGATGNEGFGFHEYECC